MSMCVVGVTASVTESSSDVIALAVSGSDVTVRANDDVIILRGSHTEGGVTLEQTNNIDYVITTSNYQLNVKKLDVYFAVHLSTSRDECSENGGLCGQCDGSESLSTQASSNPSFSQVNINSAVLDYVMTSGDGDDAVSRAGYAVHIDGVGTASSTFPADVWQTDDDWVTIEIIANILDANGVLLSYAREQVFALTLNNGVLAFQNGAEEGELGGFQVATNEWISLVVRYDVTNGDTMVQQIRADGYEYQMTGLSLPLNIFPDRGRMALGDWQLSTSNAGSRPSGTFRGFVDSVLIWSKRHTPHDLLRHHDYYILSTEPHVSVLWNFDEGYGTTVYDKIRGIRMRVVEGSWVTSGADISQGEVAGAAPPESLIQSASQFAQARDNCTELLAEALTGSCASMTSLNSFYYLHCMSVVGESGRISGAIDSVIFAQQMCNDVTGGSRNVIDVDLCGRFGDRRYSTRTGDDCSGRCEFGKQLLTSLQLTSCLSHLCVHSGSVVKRKV